ncbi:velvet factor-domain-containing protein [Halteromyces radiatus]|uniref:velvet factor-domain-containing protein n=1 Tax=Halteromyces radiatus TaxID=101107 RepID=UPI00221E92DA|nr:velvet factor-domain-containing protein [Halteromyces radiatus]KAI8086073.1 velvet factor-domain-containing protein [Halteromyces radiatus]
MTASSLLESATPSCTTPSKYRLVVRQQPEKARLCSFKEKVDRRPLDPPPIVQLFTDKSSQLRYPYFFLYATLVTETGDEDLTFLESARTTAGTTVQSLHRLRDCDNDEGAFFIFADVSIRMEGFFRLRFTLFEIIGPYAISRCSELSDVFQVYSPKSFPGMSESTFLTRLFSEQGVRIRIRKETRTNVSPPTKRRRSDIKQERQHVTISSSNDDNITTTHSIMSMKNILSSPIQESPQKFSPPPTSRILPIPSRTLLHPEHSTHPSSLSSSSSSSFTHSHYRPYLPQHRRFS